jgi:hypothetical protein
MLIASFVLWTLASGGYIAFRAGSIAQGGHRRDGHPSVSAMTPVNAVDPLVALRNVVELAKRIESETRSDERTRDVLGLLAQAEGVPGAIPPEVRAVVLHELTHSDNGDHVLMNILMYLLSVDDKSIVPDLFEIYGTIPSADDRRRVAICAFQIDREYVSGRLAEPRTDLARQFAEDVEKLQGKR